MNQKNNSEKRRRGRQPEKDSPLRMKAEHKAELDRLIEGTSMRAAHLCAHAAKIGGYAIKPDTMRRYANRKRSSIGIPSPRGRLSTESHFSRQLAHAWLAAISLSLPSSEMTTAVVRQMAAMVEVSDATEEARQ